ncbi:MAG: ABC-type sugar transport system permease subunit [Phycisphaerales bacterium]|jgi:ABC-type sugar transport system permease subunit
MTEAVFEMPDADAVKLNGGGGAMRVDRAAWLFLSPFLLIFGVFVVYPLSQSLVLAFQQTYGPESARWVGLDNFKNLFGDKLFFLAIRNTLVYTLGSLFIQLPLSLGLAMLLNRPGLRGRGIYRLIFFSPQLMGLVFAAMLAMLVFEKQNGLLNQALHGAFGFDLDFPWLQVHVMWTLIITSLWMYVGYNMIFFLAALQSIDKSLLEAASVDGAGPASQFWNITVPSIRPVASVVVLLSIIGSLQLFELPWIMLDSTPGPGNRGLTIVMYLYQKGFETGDLGYASAIGWALAVMLIGLALLQLWMVRREDR